MNFITQIFSIAAFNLKSIPARLGAAVTGAVGIAGVVAVLTGVLAIASGFRAAMTASGSPDAAIVLRAGADSELTSGLSREEVRLISDAEGVQRTAEGPLASAELFVIIDLPKRSSNTSANVPLRGVGAAAFTVRGDIEVVQGRRFEPGKNEVMVGAGAARAFTGWTNDVLLFKFDKDQHDFGQKTFLGRTGPFDGEDIIDTILAQRVTAEFVAAKIYRFFVREEIGGSLKAELEHLTSAFKV